MQDCKKCEELKAEVVSLKKALETMLAKEHGGKWKVGGRA